MPFHVYNLSMVFGKKNTCNEKCTLTRTFNLYTVCWIYMFFYCIVAGTVLQTAFSETIKLDRVDSLVADPFHANLSINKHPTDTKP